MDTTTVYDKTVDKWRHNPNGIVVYNEHLDLFVPLFTILQKIYTRNKNSKTLIILSNVNQFDLFTTKIISSRIFTYFDLLNINIKVINLFDIVTIDPYDTFDLLVLLRAEDILYDLKYQTIVNNIETKYMLLLSNDAGISTLTSLPIIDMVTKSDIIVKSISNSIVEYDLAVYLSDKDRIRLNDLNEFIKDTITIFQNNIDMVFKCFSGGYVNGINMSGDYFRQKVSEQAGWSKDLDLSIDYYANVDRFYNPNALFERAKHFHEIINNRKQLLSDNESKLEPIYEIVKNNPDKYILIISKRGEFAMDITKYLNSKIKYNKEVNVFNYKVQSSNPLEPNVCLDFNSSLETIQIKRNGDYIRSKSGSIKSFGSTSLSNFANDLFSEGVTKVLSCNDALPPTGKFKVDLVIFTSPECKRLSELRHRVKELLFNNTEKVLNIYLIDTKEQDVLSNNHSLNKNNVENIKNITEIVW